jgi:purine-binding chemotaxis protein CheW
MSTPNGTDARAQYLAFGLAGGEYAIGILRVREILQYEEITRVPSTPRSIRGVINLRGSVVPVVDLAVKFGLGETPVGKRTCILVFEARVDGADTVLGLVTDSVTEVIELGPADIEKPPSFGTGVQVEYLVGMGKLGRRFVLLLDLEKVLSAGEREAVRAVTEDGVAPPEAVRAPEAQPAA